jgi:hypothetical protein
MSVIGLIGHLGLLLHCGQDVKSIVENLVQKKESYPSSAEFKSLLDDAIALLQSGIIGLPADVQATMVSALQLAESQLFPAK